MGFVQRPTSANDFHPDESWRPNEDMLKITLDNGQTVFAILKIGKDLPEWRISPDFISTSLADSVTTTLKYDVWLSSGFIEVGRRLRLIVESRRHQHLLGDFASAAKVRSIEACTYKDAYHDDLTLAEFAPEPRRHRPLSLTRTGGRPFRP